MKYRISHTTRYMSNNKVGIGMNQVHLSPRETPWQTCVFHRIYADPIPTSNDRQHDYFGNQVNYFSFENGYTNLEIKSISRVKITPRGLPSDEESQPFEEILDRLQGPLTPQILHGREMTCISPNVPFFAPPIADYARKTFTKGKPLLVGLRELLDRFNNDFQFDGTSTTVHTPVIEVFENRRGVCQDFAQLLIAMLRGIGLPARYVSGYIRTVPPEGRQRLRGADASHAWVGVYAGDLGWVDIDPTNNMFVSEDHVTVAWGRDYTDVPPVRGIVIGAGPHSLKVHVDVEPYEDDTSTN
jgi:transglutaminase-like putative cysteine protease